MKKRIGIISLIIIFVGISVIYIHAYKTKQHISSTAKIVSIKSTSIQQKPTITNVPVITSQISSNTCNDLLVLVNKIYGLSSYYVPPDLVSLSSYAIPTTGSGFQLRLIVISDLKKMFADASALQLNLSILSPYRSYAYQQTVHSGYVQAEGEAAADRASATPGHSQHQLGTAMDFTTSEIHNALDASFASTAAGKWLLANAYKYGFILSYPEGEESVTGYEYEPWHYRYIGVDNAQKIINSGLILEQYLQKYEVLPNC